MENNPNNRGGETKSFTGSILTELGELVVEMTFNKGYYEYDDGYGDYGHDDDDYYDDGEDY